MPCYGLEESGEPLHVSQIIEKLGRENDKKNRVSISSQIQAYVRKGVVFTKTAPNTFGLIEYEAEKKEAPEGASTLL